MDKEALSDVIYSIDTAKEIIKTGLWRAEDCGLDEISYSTMKLCFSKSMEMLDIARKDLAIIKDKDDEDDDSI